MLPLARLRPPLELRDSAEAAEAAVAAAECPRAEGEIHEDEGGRALGHDGRGAALVGARAPHAAVVVVARRIRVRLAVVAFAAAENRGGRIEFPVDIRIGGFAVCSKSDEDRI